MVVGGGGGVVVVVEGGELEQESDGMEKKRSNFRKLRRGCLDS